MSNGLNTQEGQLREKERIGAPIPRVPYDYAGWRRQSAPLPRVETPIGSQTPQDFGESRFDSRVTLPQQLDNLNEFRAEEQTSLGKVANGIAKMGIFAGTTFLDGTIGMLYGAGKAISEGDWSGLWDNEISNAMSDVQRWSEKVLPNYYTESELDGNIHFTANFLGDKFLKNLGFTFGAIGSALLFNKGVGLLKLPKIAEYLTKSKQASAAFSFILGNAVQSLNEARVEANNNSREWYDNQKRQLDAYHESRKEELLNTAVDEADYARLSALEDDAYQKALQRLGEDTARMGNADMAGNFGLLMLTNSMGLGRMYARGFNTQRRILNASRKLNKLQAGKNLSSGTVRGLVTGLKDTFMEGAEEMSQSMIAKGTGNYYGNDVMSFYDASIDFENTKNSVDMLNAMGKGIHEQLNDPLAWEEFLIGSLTGATGVIRVGKNNVDVPIVGSVGLQGGILGATMESRRNAARENAIIKRVNESLANPRITAMLRGINRHVTEQGKMDLAAKEGDAKAFKDAEYSQLISDIITFDACGMLTDYKNLINTTLGNGHLTDEQLQSIRESTKNIVDGKDIGPYAEFTEDADGNNKMREKLEHTRKALLDAVDQYQDAYKEIDMQTDGIFSEDQLAELVWMKTRLGDWANRSKELTSSIVDRLRNLKEHVYTNRDGNLNEFIAVNAVEGEEFNLQKLSAYLKSSGKRHIDIDKSVDALVDIIEKNKRMLGPMLVSKADPRSNSTLFMGIEAWLQNLKNKAEELVTDGTDVHIDELLQELRDLQQMTLDAQEFNSKLTEFMADPKKFEAAHKKSNKKAKKAEAKHQAEQVVTEAQNKSNDAEAATVLNNATPEQKEAMKGNPWVKYINTKFNYLGQLEANIDSQTEIPENFRTAAKQYLEGAFNIPRNPEEYEAFVKNPWDILTQLGLNDPYVGYVINSAFKKQSDNEAFAELFNAYVEPSSDVIIFSSPVNNDDSNFGSPSVGKELLPTETIIPASGDQSLPVLEDSKVTEAAKFAEKPVSYLQTGLPKIAIESRTVINEETGKKEGSPADYNTPSWEIIDAKLPVTREAAWNYLYADNSNRVMTYKEVLMSPDFTKGTEIYFGIKPDIWYQYDQDKVSNYKRYVVFMYYKYHNSKTNEDRYIPVGTVITKENYTGAVPLIERVTTDFLSNYQDGKITDNVHKDTFDEEVFIHPSLSTKVSEVLPGFIPYINSEKSLKDISIGNDVKFSIVKPVSRASNVLTFVGVPSDIRSKISYNMNTLRALNGRIVMLIPRADGLYTPVPVKTKDVDAEDIIANKNKPFYKEIYDAIQALVNTADTNTAAKNTKALKDLLYLNNVRIGYYNENGKVKDEDDTSENNKEFTTLGFVNRRDLDERGEKRKDNPNEVLKTLYLQKSENPDENVLNFISLVKQASGNSTDQNSSKIYYNINTKKIGNPDYIESIIDGDVLTCNIERAETYCDFFRIPTYDSASGKMQEEIVGNVATTSPIRPIVNSETEGISRVYDDYTNFNNSGNSYKLLEYSDGRLVACNNNSQPLNVLETVNLGNNVTVYLSDILIKIHQLHNDKYNTLYTKTTVNTLTYNNANPEVYTFTGVDDYIFIKNGNKFDIVTDPTTIKTIKQHIAALANASKIVNGNNVQPKQQSATLATIAPNGVEINANLYNNSLNVVDLVLGDVEHNNKQDIYYINSKGAVINVQGYKIPNTDNYLVSLLSGKTDNQFQVTVFVVNSNGYRSVNSAVLTGENPPICTTTAELVAKPEVSALLEDVNIAKTSTDTSKDLRKFRVAEPTTPVVVPTASTDSASTDIESTNIIPENDPVRAALEKITSNFSIKDNNQRTVINRNSSIYIDNLGHSWLRFHCMQGRFDASRESLFNLPSNQYFKLGTEVNDAIIQGNIYDAYLRSYFMYGDAEKADHDAKAAFDEFINSIEDKAFAEAKKASYDGYLNNLKDKFKDIEHIYITLKSAGYKFLTTNLVVSASIPYSKDNSSVNPVVSYLRMAGEMDLIMEKNGEYYIVDFKNSKTDPKDNEFYRTQLAFYKYALESSIPELKGKVHTLGWIWHDKISGKDSLQTTSDIDLSQCAIPLTAQDVTDIRNGIKQPNTLFFSRVAEKAVMELQANTGTVIQTSVESKKPTSTKKIPDTIKDKLPKYPDGKLYTLTNSFGLEIPIGVDYAYRVTLVDGRVFNENYTGYRNILSDSLNTNTVKVFMDKEHTTESIPADSITKVEVLIDGNWVTVTSLNDDTRNNQNQLNELLNHLRESGFTVKSKADMEKFLQENGLNDVQELVIGEKGAKLLDTTEEATMRMDNLSVANDMEKAGKDALTIKKATGWERGADGKWRYEIMDLHMKKDVPVIPNKSLNLEDLFEKNELFDIYPELRKIKVWFTPEAENLGAEAAASYAKKTVIIKPTNIKSSESAYNTFRELNEKASTYKGEEIEKARELALKANKGQKDKSTVPHSSELEDYLNKHPYAREWYDIITAIYAQQEKLRTEKVVRVSSNLESILNHEVQHLIQSIEGFAPGGNFDIARDYIKNQLIKAADKTIDIKTLNNRIERIRKWLNKNESLSEKHRLELLNKIGKMSQWAEELRGDYINNHKVALSKEELRELYERFAGEVEARTVQNRMQLSKEERRNSLFTDDMYKDVVKEDLVFLKTSLNEDNLAVATIEQEMQQIKAKAIADGTFMKAPNGNPTNLNERQWLQVRTKAFKNWFGDWTKITFDKDGKVLSIPEGVSKVVDENGEPLVVYHGSDSKFTVFDIKNREQLDLSKLVGKKHFFSSEKSVAKYFARDNEVNMLHTISMELENVGEEEDEQEVWNYIGNHIGKTGQETKNIWFDAKKSGKVNRYGDVEIMPNLDGKLYEVFLNIKNPLILDANQERADKFIETNEEKIKEAESIIIKNIDETVGDKIATDYIVSNSNQIKSATDNNGNFSPESDDIQELRTSDGNLYGFVDKDNNIYIDETAASVETPIHEYTHIWDKFVAKENPELWQRGVELMKQLPIWTEIENDPNYGGKWGDREDKEFLIASEVHARLVGEEGAEIINEYKDKSVIKAIKDWISEVWTVVKDIFSKWTNQDLSDLSIADFTAMTLKDFVNKTPLIAKVKLDIEAAPNESSSQNAGNPTSEGATKMLDDLFNSFPRKVVEDASPANFDKELAWLKSHLGISEEDGLEIIDTLIDINDGHGTQAYGQFKNAAIKISRMMAKGTAYHEAFHAVMHLMLKPSELSTVIEEARKLYNIDDPLELEERLADSFMEYMIDEEYVGNTISDKLKAVFTKIKRFLKHILGMEDYLDNLFYKIKSGNFSQSYSMNKDKAISNASLISKAILANNGRSLSTSPDGQKSELYEALKRELDGTEEAILAKAYSFSPDFVGWLHQKQSSENLSNEQVYYANGEVKSSFVLERLKELGITDLHTYIPYNTSNDSGSDKDYSDRSLSKERYKKLVTDALKGVPVSKLKESFNNFINAYLNNYGIKIVGTVKNKVISIKEVIDMRKYLNIFNSDGTVKSRQQLKAEAKQVSIDSWKTLTDKQREMLSADNINEDLWNSLSKEERDNIIECL